MWPDRVSNPGPPTYESGALPIALRGPALKKQKEKRKYVARPGIEPRTPDLRVRCPTDCATRPGNNIKKASVEFGKICYIFSIFWENAFISSSLLPDPIEFRVYCTCCYF